MTEAGKSGSARLSLAETACTDRGWAFQTLFRHQFLICQDRPRPFPGWTLQRCGVWTVHHCPDLPAYRLRNRRGAELGLLLGVAMVPGEGVLRADYTLDLEPDDPALMQALEEFVSSLSGRFAVLIHSVGEDRFYVDPTANLGSVYDGDTGRIASTLGLLLEGDLDPEPSLKAEDVQAHRARFLFGMTADARVRRILPNHYLDLSDFVERRFWPRDGDAFDPEGERREAICRRIALGFAENTTALMDAYRCALPITGGADSRMLLATARTHLDKAAYFFTLITNWSSEMDAIIARKIATHLMLPHLIVSRDAPVVQAAFTAGQIAEHRDQMRLASGFDNSGKTDTLVRTTLLTPECDLVLRGNILELTRAIRWRGRLYRVPCNSDTGVGIMMSDAAMEPLGRAYWSKRYEAWAETLPDACHPRLYDFAFTELWVPATESPNYYAQSKDFFINPFNDRRLIHQTMKLHPRYRYRRALNSNILQALSPDLIDIPYHAAAKVEWRHLKQLQKNGPGNARASPTGRYATS